MKQGGETSQKWGGIPTLIEAKGPTETEDITWCKLTESASNRKRYDVVLRHRFLTGFFAKVRTTEASMRGIPTGGLLNKIELWFSNQIWKRIHSEFKNAAKSPDVYSKVLKILKLDGEEGDPLVVFSGNMSTRPALEQMMRQFKGEAAAIYGVSNYVHPFESKRDLERYVEVYKDLIRKLLQDNDGITIVSHSAGALFAARALYELSQEEGDKNTLKEKIKHVSFAPALDLNQSLFALYLQKIYITLFRDLIPLVDEDAIEYSGGKTPPLEIGDDFSEIIPLFEIGDDSQVIIQRLQIGDDSKMSEGVFVYIQQRLIEILQETAEFYPVAFGSDEILPGSVKVLEDLFGESVSNLPGSHGAILTLPEVPKCVRKILNTQKTPQ